MSAFDHEILKSERLEKHKVTISWSQNFCSLLGSTARSVAYACSFSSAMESSTCSRAYSFRLEVET